RQIIERTSATNFRGFGARGLDYVDQGIDRVPRFERYDPLLPGQLADHLFDDGVAQGFLVREVVIQRPFGHPCPSEDSVQVGALIPSLIDLLEAGIKQTATGSLRIAARAGFPGVGSTRS